MNLLKKLLSLVFIFALAGTLVAESPESAEEELLPVEGVPPLEEVPPLDAEGNTFDEDDEVPEFSSDELALLLQRLQEAGFFDQFEDTVPDEDTLPDEDTVPDEGTASHEDTIFGDDFLLDGEELFPLEEDASEEVSVSEKEVNDKEPGLLYKVYLSKGELDAKILRYAYLRHLSPQEINLALRDIRKFIRNAVKKALKDPKKQIDEFALTNILHIFGHIYMFIEHTWIDNETEKIKAVYEPKDRVNNVPGATRLLDYWAEKEKTEGLKLHTHKFYANAIDFLIVMVRSYLIFPCRSMEDWKEMNKRWVLWLVNKLAPKMERSLAFGGYYHENIELFKEIFAAWVDDYKKTLQLQRRSYLG